MIIRSVVIASVLFVLFSNIYAQTVLKGKTYEAETDSVITAVNISHLNKNNLSARTLQKDEQGKDVDIY